MIFCIGGDVHGKINEFYREIEFFEKFLKVRFNMVLQVGDFGIYPTQTDPRFRCKGSGTGDFDEYLRGERRAPYPTIFIKGNHEDHRWLEQSSHKLHSANLKYLRNARFAWVGNLPIWSPCPFPIKISGIGGCFSPKTYVKTRNSCSPRHYTANDIDILVKDRGDRPDILLFHDAPEGIHFEKYGHGGREYTSNAKGLRELIAATKPKVCFFGHHHTRIGTEVEGVPCFGLAQVGSPGAFFAIEMDEVTKDWKYLGAW